MHESCVSNLIQIRITSQPLSKLSSRCLRRIISDVGRDFWRRVMSSDKVEAGEARFELLF